MKKVAPFLLLICVGLGLCVNSLIPSLPLSVTSKVIILTLSSCAFSSAALMVLVWALRDSWSTTKRPDSLNRLATLAKKEREIQARRGLDTKKTSDYVAFDVWLELNEQDRRNILRSSHWKENQHV